MYHHSNPRHIFELAQTSTKLGSTEQTEYDGTKVYTICRLSKSKNKYLTWRSELTRKMAAIEYVHKDKKQ